jgi:hypothetical protein
MSSTHFKVKLGHYSKQGRKHKTKNPSDVVDQDRCSGRMRSPGPWHWPTSTANERNPPSLRKSQGGGLPSGNFADEPHGHFSVHAVIDEFNVLKHISANDAIDQLCPEVATLYFDIHRNAMHDFRRDFRIASEKKPLPPKYRLLLFSPAPEMELIWQGKSSEVINVVLPFQSIEQIDEPREHLNGQKLFTADAITGRQSQGWTNKLIWGDNKLALSSLKNGPLRREIEAAGGLKLIYIDPPFDVGADFSFDIEIGEETLTKEPSVIEEIAYRDTGVGELIHTCL